MGNLCTLPSLSSHAEIRYFSQSKIFLRLLWTVFVNGVILILFLLLYSSVVKLTFPTNLIKVNQIQRNFIKLRLLWIISTKTKR